MESSSSQTRSVAAIATVVQAAPIIAPIIAVIAAATILGARSYRVTQYFTRAEELDRMASDAGLALAERWSDWRGTPPDDRSPFHISLYVRSDGSQQSPAA